MLDNVTHVGNTAVMLVMFHDADISRHDKTKFSNIPVNAPNWHADQRIPGKGGRPFVLSGAPLIMASVRDSKPGRSRARA